MSPDAEHTSKPLKALVVYESMFGNTETIAQAIALGLADAGEVTLADVATMPSAAGMDLLVVGGPTHAFGLSRPASRLDAGRQGVVRPGATDVGLREYLDVSPRLTELAAATFDTRVDKFWVPGSAAHKAHRRLRRLGCRMLCPAESFRVSGMTGPLAGGETKRAGQWAAMLAAALLAERHSV